MNQTVKLKIREYSSPLELLDHLISERKDDIFDLPIAELSQHYIEVLEESSRQGLDMNLASEFIVMAASLMEIKTRMLLPGRMGRDEDSEDPRRDLVLQLMAYRRMKNLAQELEKRHEYYSPVPIRALIAPADLGLDLAEKELEQELEPDLLWAAAERVVTQNKERYNQETRWIKRMLKQDQWTVKDKVREIYYRLQQNTKIAFSELFSRPNPSRGERISAFLAVLELAHDGTLTVNQEVAFGEISLEACDGK